MISYNWGHQEVIKNISSGLIASGYTVWLDLEHMAGSTLEASMCTRLTSYYGFIHSFSSFLFLSITSGTCGRGLCRSAHLLQQEVHRVRGMPYRG